VSLREEHGLALIALGTAREELLRAENRESSARESVLLAEAEVVRYGDAEPGKRPAEIRYYLGASGVTWYRSGDGWRHRNGECLFGSKWELLGEGHFPMVQIVGRAAVARGLATQ